MKHERLEAFYIFFFFISYPSYVLAVNIRALDGLNQFTLFCLN